MSYPSPNNCPIRERTADGISVGRCYFYCPDDVCPRHGNVHDELEHYRDTGRLTDETLDLSDEMRAHVRQAAAKEPK